MSKIKFSHLTQRIVDKEIKEVQWGGMLFKQVLEAGLVRRSTDTNSVVNELQEAATRAQQALSNTATEVSQVLGVDNLPAPETLASELHNQSLSFARTVGQFVGQLQNEVSFEMTLYHIQVSNLHTSA
jgi:phosphomevalonate kinase